MEPTNSEADRQLRELVIYRKISLFIQSEIERRFIETIFILLIAIYKWNKVKPLAYLKESTEFYRLKLFAPPMI